MAEWNPRVNELFVQAIQMTAATERQAFLDSACGNDAELRMAVDTLMKAHDQAGNFLNSPHVPMDSTIDQLTVEKPGTQIGPYKLLQQIGEGGMGVVFMAEQTQPVQRKVALKIIKPGMDSKQVIARFEAERQALAMMDHVNIARVIDGGTTESGRPYFVMELINGVPITKYCDDNHLTPRERLELFVPVCQAIQHAHQKGIIHRDIKPSNVLVTLYDGKPVPKVIDFGVAKAIEQKLTERTLFTNFGTMVGTLEYMSPEQVEMSALGVDTRSDIYSLGVLLYELLTGSTPLNRKQVRSAAYAEILRLIKDEEPPKPSTRLSNSGDELASISALRRTEPSKLSKIMRGELDWIVMKTLEKDRNRRYETVNSFAADVQRYLADEPVLACPPTVGYRLRKFARRNKVGLAVAALVLFFLTLLGSGIGWMVRDRAARQSRIAAQVDLILGEVDRLEKEQKWPEALAAVQRAEVLTADGADATTQERVRQVLSAVQMVATLEELRLREAPGTTGSKVIDEGNHHLYSAAFRNFGVDVEALPAEESAARLRARPALVVAFAAALDDWARAGRRRDLDQSKRLWALATAVDPDPWRASVRQAAAAMDAESLIKLANDPNTARQPPQSQTLLQVALRQCGQPEIALALLERACEFHPSDFWIHYELALLNAHVRPPRLEAALRHNMAARALAPGRAVTWVNLGVNLKLVGKLDEAMACYRRAIELDPKSDSGPYIGLSNVLRDQKKFDEAVVASRKAIEIDPSANAYTSLGSALKDQRKSAEAVTAFRKAIELDPKAAGTYNNLGLALEDQKKLDEAITAYRTAIEIDPKIAFVYMNLGRTLAHQGKWDEAADAYRKAIQIDSKLTRAYFSLGSILHYQRKLDEAVVAYRKYIESNPKDALVYHYLGLILDEQKKWDEAIAAYRKAIELNPKYSLAYFKLGNALTDRKKLPEAIATYRKAVELDPKHALSWGNLGFALTELKELPEAVAACRKAIELDPNIAGLHYNLGNALNAQGNHGEAIVAYRKTVQLDPKLAFAWHNLGNALSDQHDMDEAIAAYRQAIKQNPKLAQPHYSLGNALLGQQKLDEAIISYRKAIELDPRYAVAWGNLGSALMAQGKFGDAVVAFEECNRLLPNDAAAANKLARLLANCPDLKLRNAARAVELSTKAVHLDPTKSTYLSTLGVAHYRAGNWKAALEALDKSMKLGKGGDGLDWFFLAMAHWQLGNKQPARQWYAQAVEWTDKHQPKDEELRRFQAEARQLIGVEKEQD